MRLNDLVAMVRRDREGAAHQPPAVAVRDPFVEVLMEELRAFLPEGLRGRLDSVEDVEEVYELLAAAALVRAVQGRDDLRRAVGEEMRCAAGSELAAISRALGLWAGPPRQPAWRGAQRLGSLLAAMVSALLLVVELLLLVGVARLFRQPHGPAAVLAVGGVWCMLGAAFGPRILGAVRALPARARGLPTAWLKHAGGAEALWAAAAWYLATCAACWHWPALFFSVSEVQFYVLLAVPLLLAATFAWARLHGGGGGIDR